MSKERDYLYSGALKKYLSGTLSEAESKHFLEAMEADSFEKKALEGFNSIEDKAALLVAVKSVESSVAQKTGMQQQSSVAFPKRRMMGIAASLALLIVVVFALSHFMKDEQQVSVSISNPTLADIPLPEPDLVPENIEIQDEIADEELMLDSTQNLQQDLDELIDVVALLDPEMDTVFKEEMIIEKETIALKLMPISLFAEDGMKDEIEAIETKALTTSLNQQNIEMDAVSEVLPALSVDTSESSSYFDIGRATYEGKDYDQAINYFQEAINSNNNVTESQYYVAMGYYGMNKPNKAIKYFDTVISDPVSPLSNNAKWYKSLIMEERGLKDEAIKLLKELANGDSGFKNQAQDKLKAMN